MNASCLGNSRVHESSWQLESFSLPGAGAKPITEHVARIRSHGYGSYEDDEEDCGQEEDGHAFGEEANSNEEVDCEENDGKEVDCEALTQEEDRNEEVNCEEDDRQDDCQAFAEEEDCNEEDDHQEQSWQEEVALLTHTNKLKTGWCPGAGLFSFAPLPPTDIGRFRLCDQPHCELLPVDETLCRR